MTEEGDPREEEAFLTGPSEGKEKRTFAESWVKLKQKPGNFRDKRVRTDVLGRVYGGKSSGEKDLFQEARNNFEGVKP